MTAPIAPPSSERMSRAAALAMLCLSVGGWGLLLLVGLAEAWHSVRHAASPQGSYIFATVCGGMAVFWVMLLRDTGSSGRWGLARLFQGRLAGIGALALGLSAVLFLLGLFEAAILSLCYLASGNTAPDLALEQPHNLEARERYGWAGIPGIFNHRCEAKGDHPGFDVTYTQNEFGHRVVDDLHKNATKHIAFLGCSFTFGTGVQDIDTLPAKVAVYLPGYRAYNFAFGGWGPAQAVSLLQEEEITQEIKEPQGVGVYVFIEDHVRRAISSMRRRNSWTRDFPVYNLDGPAPEYLGPFSRVQPIRTWIYAVLPHEQFFAYSGLDWPITPSAADCGYTAKLIGAARDLYLKRFPGSKFYVLIHPLHGDLRGTQMTIDALAKLEVPVLNYVGMLDGTNPAYSLSDTHPTALANKLIAHRLAVDIGRAP